MDANLGPERCGKDVSGNACQDLGKSFLHMPKVMLLLERQPKLRRSARQPGQASGHLRGDCSSARENPMESLPGNPQLPGCLAHRKAKTRQDSLA
jgi:hypothetical protein